MVAQEDEYAHNTGADHVFPEKGNVEEVACVFFDVNQVE